ncbi:alanine racemase [Collinsella sp. zg1085]|uniref:alanine racemase n=1 Tax=Collinsella sp. zg1085 TaxID=2844380 RepID=UPI001C0BE479|nr:alanine racemase [Collinsella sp. zg1085]QWT17710.1 alanine racemase [Collinsella sp. zg1085]
MPLTHEPALRWAWVEIHQGALRRNVRAFKQLLGPRQRLCCAVKADAYGHGAVASAKIMHATGADMFAVATVAEGIELREGGIVAPILVLAEPPITAIEHILAYDLMPAIYTSEFALAFGEYAVHAGKVGKYHLAIDTGMNRIGVHHTEALEFRRSIDFHRGIVCDGVFTHFATADEPDGWDYKLQCRRFEEVIAALKDAGFDCGLVHCDNTAASILDASTHFDMVRAGIGLYGLQPCGLTAQKIQLDPVMSVHARITRVVNPAMGEGVSYNYTYRVPRARVQLCTLPLGYGDGLARVLSNRMDVLFQGQRVRQVGNICMDQCMMAIQETSARQMPTAEIGDYVTIIGRDGDAEITLDEHAQMRGTINYEVACDFGMRLEKVYR